MRIGTFDAKALAAAKEASRRKLEDDLSSGKITLAEIKALNFAFGHFDLRNARLEAPDPDAKL